MKQNGTPPNLLHVAFIQQPKQGRIALFLRKKEDGQYLWYEKLALGEKETSVSGKNIEEAMKRAHSHWKNCSFRTLICGFRYTLPERDEHGSNALFHQMVASYSSMNGVYFDEELGHLCAVQNASQEALLFWKTYQY